MQGVGRVGASGAMASEKIEVANSPLSTGGAGGLLSTEKDSKEAATSTQFGDIYKQIQAKYGEKPEKPREIKKTLGKDDFLKIMITQMKNQDPTSPFKAEQMATEIAQFTSVEQLQNVNQNLNKMTTQNKPLEQMAMTNLIGKFVTIDRERFPHSEGQNDDLEFSLSKNAASVHVVVISEAGEQVFEKDMGAQKSGNVNLNWNGIKTNSLPAKAGNYFFRVDAKDDQGKPIEMASQVHSRVIGVSFENAEPVFLVGDARHQDKVTMRNILKIEVDSNPANAVGASKKESLPAAPVQEKNMISFRRGVGSEPMAATTSPVIPENVLEKVSIKEEKGFPNGLKEGGEIQ